MSVVVVCNPVPVKDSSRLTSKHNGDEYQMLFYVRGRKRDGLRVLFSDLCKGSPRETKIHW